MKIEAMRWMLLTLSGAPIKDTNEARHKAKALKEIADRLDKKDKANG